MRLVVEASDKTMAMLEIDRKSYVTKIEELLEHLELRGRS
jgi:hypothetical protein